MRAREEEGEGDPDEAMSVGGWNSNTRARHSLPALTCPSDSAAVHHSLDSREPFVEALEALLHGLVALVWLAHFRKGIEQSVGERVEDALWGAWSLVDAREVAQPARCCTCAIVASARCRRRVHVHLDVLACARNCWWVRQVPSSAIYSTTRYSPIPSTRGNFSTVEPAVVSDVCRPSPERAASPPLSSR